MVWPAAEHEAVSLSGVPPTSRQRGFVYAVAAILLAAFALAAPFATVQLPAFVSFNPSVESVVFVNDLITSFLLFWQFAITRSRSMLALAIGYLYTAAIVVPKILVYPGAFTGLLGGGAQSSAWLYYFWSAGLPVAVIAYALLDDAHRESRPTGRSTRPIIVRSIACVAGLVIGMAWLATAGERFLPPLVASDRYLFATVYVANPLLILATIIAFAVLWTRRRSVLDYWLLLTMFALILNFVLAAFFARQRYSLGFYASRGFTLAASMIVLALLLREMTTLYTRLASSNLMLARERSNKLMNVEATAAVIAHEIRQPLTAIVLNANTASQLLEKAPPDIHEVQDVLKDIAGDGVRTSEALDAIRSMFREDDLRHESIDINAIVLEVLHSMRGELSDLGIVAQSELTPALPHIEGNRAQLHQVVFNLVHNAIEAMQSATHRARILRLITQPREGDTIAVAIQDSGPGIDPRRLDGLFDAFETTKSQGTGLGLAICRVIIERHGGRLMAHSDGHSGALFQFVLPISDIERHVDRARS